MRSSNLIQSILTGLRGFASHAARNGESVGSISSKHAISGVINVPQRILM